MKVLLVENESSVEEIFLGWSRSNRYPFTLECVHCSEAAIISLSVCMPDIIFLGLPCPRAPLCDLQRDARLSTVPIVVLSNKDRLYQRVLSAQCNVAVLPKPPEEAGVRRLLEELRTTA